MDAAGCWGAAGIAKTSVSTAIDIQVKCLISMLGPSFFIKAPSSANSADAVLYT
jgi:hypothetical protein